ncbi:DeoR/GlpR family DNA-binding transcription regulator [Occallatibacter riparius]|uniref:DeoR/GlpR family DNA-binding transcription regulator n=1 Tax=Occallatibacter riparius TaxID=1002689 RepID=A0A9J7BQ03_9BACT|nr:DeoR/GlpR family DNA-binding transcription regulator [Occallatibacter riparius]UWZ84784.1 DeoR/GlpR family DNA-binding transcription regulator [Occallatibacter riparius]
MLTSYRKQQLLEMLKADGKLVAKDLSARFDVSEDTIRRDLRELAQEGLLQRVHGGALPASPAIADFAGREQIRHEGKVGIGRTAAGLIQPGQTVILDGGTTAREIARHLPPQLQATVITHSPTIAIELVEHKAVEVILLGGRLFKHSVVSVGAACFEAISRIRADLFFMGVTGIHTQAGLTTGDYEEAAVKRALSNAAAETYVLASAEKWNAASPYLVLGLSEVAGVITEPDIGEAITQPYRELGLSILRG